MTPAEAQAYCTALTKKSGSNFYYSFLFLPRHRRQAMYTVYAFCKEVDSAVDDPPPGSNPHEELRRWRKELESAYHGTPTFPVTISLAEHARRLSIPQAYFEELIKGVEMDLTRRRYETFDELRRYCYQVAAAVGLAALPIFGCRDVRSRHYAEALGIALQLTNILRDLPEDAERGRIYLPLEDLRRFGYGERDLLTHARGNAFRALIRCEVDRARSLYRAARANVAARDRRALVAAEGMRLVYQRLLARIASDPEAIFGPRLRVPMPEKALCVVTAWLRSRGARR